MIHLNFNLDSNNILVEICYLFRTFKCSNHPKINENHFLHLLIEEYHSFYTLMKHPPKTHH